MPEDEQSVKPGACPVDMWHGEPCGRITHKAPRGVDKEPVCLMHSLDPDKDKKEFRREIDAILNDESDYHPHRNTYNFVSFFFPEADFRNLSLRA